jgi:hypothetical protein
MVAIILAATVMPAYADKRAENNKNIANFILDTIKLPYMLLGAFVKQDHEKVKKELEYKEHQGLKECLR